MLKKIIKDEKKRINLLEYNDILEKELISYFKDEKCCLDILTYLKSEKRMVNRTFIKSNFVFKIDNILYQVKKRDRNNYIIKSTTSKMYILKTESVGDRLITKKGDCPIGIGISAINSDQINFLFYREGKEEFLLENDMRHYLSRKDEIIKELSFYLSKNRLKLLLTKKFINELKDKGVNMPILYFVDEIKNDKNKEKKLKTTYEHGVELSKLESAEQKGIKLLNILNIKENDIKEYAVRNLK